MYTQEELVQLLQSSWSADTACGEWSPDNPSQNQCAVTALLIQDILGGELLRCEMSDGSSHYWNRLPDGTEIDLTAEQFSHIKAYPIYQTAITRNRQYVLGFADTMLRYGILLQNFVEVERRKE
jgi:hypothetical protein